MAKNFLLEIGLEEMPAHVVLPSMNQLKETVDLTTSEFNTLQTVFDQIDALNKEHKSFAGTPDNSENIVRFVFRTKDIESKDE